MLSSKILLEPTNYLLKEPQGFDQRVNQPKAQNGLIVNTNIHQTTPNIRTCISQSISRCESPVVSDSLPLGKFLEVHSFTNVERMLNGTNPKG